MNFEPFESRVRDISTALLKIPTPDLSRSFEHSNTGIRQIVTDHIADFETEEQARIEREFFGLGPLQELVDNPDITEIIVNGRTTIFFERNGSLSRFPDRFFSEMTFRNCVERICHSFRSEFNLQFPFCSGQWKNFRVQVCGPFGDKNTLRLTLRRHPECPWTFEELVKTGWCRNEEALCFKSLIDSRKSLLVVGGTGSGKTSVLNALLQLVSENERCVILEDTPELSAPNESSIKLISRHDAQKNLRDIDLGELVTQSLRLRPDRIVMGEVRGPEAKDLLMAFATGHDGSFGTLHARSASEALIRLEMLVQLGAPQWNLQAVRNLIQLCLQYLVVTERLPSGKRHLNGIYRIASVEPFGILTEKVQIP